MRKPWLSRTAPLHLPAQTAGPYVPRLKDGASGDSDPRGSFWVAAPSASPSAGTSTAALRLNLGSTYSWFRNLGSRVG